MDEGVAGAGPVASIRFTLIWDRFKFLDGVDGVPYRCAKSVDPDRLCDLGGKPSRLRPEPDDKVFRCLDLDFAGDS